MINTEFRKNVETLEILTGSKTYFVYVLENQINGRKYYGIAKDLLSRWEAHRMDLAAGRHKNRHINSDFKKQGKADYKMSVVNVCFDKQEALSVEKELIYADQYCYNMMNKGEGKPKKYSPAQVENALRLLETNSYKQVEEMTGLSKSTLIRAKKMKTEGV